MNVSRKQSLLIILLAIGLFIVFDRIWLSQSIEKPILQRTERDSTPTFSGIVDCDTKKYLLREGDTLDKISLAYAVPADMILDWNGIVDVGFVSTPGNILMIPFCGRYLTFTPSATSTPKPLIDILPACREITVKVEQGDTLDTISINYGVPKDDIKQYNRMKTDELYPGMTLLIQLCSSMSTPTETPMK
jgi:LysM repeat protein